LESRRDTSIETPKTVAKEVTIALL
jgi:hypothetical protein